MYKLIRIPANGTVPYGMENYRLEEDGKVVEESVTIRRPEKSSTIHGFWRSSTVKVPEGYIEVYKYPPICTQDSIYPIMTIPSSMVVVIEIPK